MKKSINKLFTDTVTQKIYDILYSDSEYHNVVTVTELYTNKKSILGHLSLNYDENTFNIICNNEYVTYAIDISSMLLYKFTESMAGIKVENFDIKKIAVGDSTIQLALNNECIMMINFSSCVSQMNNKETKNE